MVIYLDGLLLWFASCFDLWFDVNSKEGIGDGWGRKGSCGLGVGEGGESLGGGLDIWE